MTLVEHRLRALVLVSLYALGLVLVWRFLGVWPAVFVALGGGVGAGILSLEREPDEGELNEEGELELLGRKGIVEPRETPRYPSAGREL